MILYIATINIPPVSKKNSQRILYNQKRGVPFIKPSVAYERYERDCLKVMARPQEPINRPVNVKCLFFMQTRRKVDLVNLLEAADDVLVKRGVLMDDNSQIVVGHDGSRVLYDKEHPRTEIVIEEI